MTNTPSAQSTLPALGRLFWMMIGPMLLALLALNILMNGGGWLTTVDLVFLALLLGLPLARWLEFTGGAPQTTTGEPATKHDLVRYAPLAVVAGLAVWIVANVIGNDWLTN